MKFKVLLSWAVTLICATLILVSCAGLRIHSVWNWDHGLGLSTHGYRHEHKGTGLVYDSGHGFSVIIGSPDYYYHRGHYYRFRKPHWEMSVSAMGQWEPVSEELLPSGLRAKARDKDKPSERSGHGRDAQENEQ